MTTFIAGIDFSAPSHEVAPQLIGVTVLVNGVGGRIVETEAYDMTEPASHTFSGPSARNASMFGPPGHAYVYLSHGIHWCLNFVCREAGHGAGVLIRAVEPLAGLDAMRVRRGGEDVRMLCSGPGKLCQAMGVTRAHNGLPLTAPPFELLARGEWETRPGCGRGAADGAAAAGAAGAAEAAVAPVAPVALAVGPRIGISKAVELPWRFGEAGSRFLSRPFR